MRIHVQQSVISNCGVMMLKIFIVSNIICIVLANIQVDESKYYQSEVSNDRYNVIYRSLLNQTFPLVRGIFNAVFGRHDNVKRFRAYLSLVDNLMKPLMPSAGYSPRIPEVWWGDHSTHVDDSIRSFKVHFSNEMIDDLRSRINNRRNLTSSLKYSFNTYGTNTEVVEHLLEYWKSDYDFKNRENVLNRYPQYVTNIQGLDIHFIHIKRNESETKKSVPILLMHGWPVTAFEYLNVIAHLLENRDDCNFVFEIIAPDLPGFGYSQATRKKGLSPYNIGVIMNNLMRRLGHKQYYIHGGDWGDIVAETMAIMFPHSTLGVHTNFPHSFLPQTIAKYFLGQLFPAAVVKPQYEDRLYPLGLHLRKFILNSGYFHIQGSRPDKLVKGLEDSPAGLMSWIIYHYMVFGDGGNSNLLLKDGNLGRNYNIDELLDSLTIYWHTQCISTSVRIYTEYSSWFQDPMNLLILMTPTKVPYALIKFRYEIIYQPDKFLKDKYQNIVLSTTMDFGGHFAGFENPYILADSIWNAVKRMKFIHKPKTDIVV